MKRFANRTTIWFWWFRGQKNPTAPGGCFTFQINCYIPTCIQPPISTFAKQLRQGRVLQKSWGMWRPWEWWNFLKSWSYESLLFSSVYHGYLPFPQPPKQVSGGLLSWVSLKLWYVFCLLKNYDIWNIIYHLLSFSRCKDENYGLSSKL